MVRLLSPGTGSIQPETSSGSSRSGPVGWLSALAPKVRVADSREKGAGEGPVSPLAGPSRMRNGSRRTISLMVPSPAARGKQGFAVAADS